MNIQREAKKPFCLRSSFPCNANSVFWAVRQKLFPKSVDSSSFHQQEILEYSPSTTGNQACLTIASNSFSYPHMTVEKSLILRLKISLEENLLNFCSFY